MLSGCRFAYALNEQRSILEQDRRDRIRKAVQISQKRKTKKNNHMMELLKDVLDGSDSDSEHGDSGIVAGRVD